jgi:hypothetical protein
MKEIDEEKTVTKKLDLPLSLNARLNNYIGTRDLGLRAKTIVILHAIEAFLDADYNQDPEYVPESLTEKIRSAQEETNKKISASWQKRR